MPAESALPFWSSILALAGSVLLVIPALRADQYLRSAHQAEALVDTIKTLKVDLSATASAQTTRTEQEKLVNAVDQVARHLNQRAKAWTPLMSVILKAGIALMVISGLLRIWATYP